MYTNTNENFVFTVNMANVKIILNKCIFSNDNSNWI